MYLLKVTGLGTRDPESGTRGSGFEALLSGARWQAMSKARATPNPNKASLIGSWELIPWELNNLSRSLLALQCPRTAPA